MGRFDELARTLRLVRVERGRPQAEIAAAARISKSMLSKYETGSQIPTLATLDRLLEALGLSLTELEQRLAASRELAEQGGDPQPLPAVTPTRRLVAKLDLESLAGLPAERRAAAEAALTELFRAVRKLVRTLS
jgi:transcriptional regulator with XRE-family HTH domain